MGLQNKTDYIEMTKFSHVDNGAMVPERVKAISRIIKCMARKLLELWKSGPIFRRTYSTAIPEGFIDHTLFPLPTYLMVWWFL